MQRFSAISLAVALSSLGCAASAAEPLVLRGVMQQMDKDALGAQAAIQRKDWDAAATFANRLAHHGEPPITEKARILGWLFTDAMTFRNYDLQVKAEAGKLQAAAQQRDGAAAQTAYDRMQQSCDGCHTSFRPAFLKHFYGE